MDTTRLDVAIGTMYLQCSDRHKKASVDWAVKNKCLDGTDEPVAFGRYISYVVLGPRPLWC